VIRAIIFDFDGVLVESVDIKTRAFAELYKEYGKEIIDKVVAYHLKNGGVSRFEKFRYYHNVLLGKSLSKEEEIELGNCFSSLVEDMVIKCPWVTGAKEFLNKFYKKIDFHIASGTPDSELLRIIKSRNMSHYFITINGSSRKKGEIALGVLNEYNYDSNMVYMVGDALSDYEGAMEANISFVGCVPENQETPFPPGIIQTDQPFVYLCSLL
jgi:phosphoglycolate phosphatase-like HAD superfamily hydrolase